MKEAAKRTKDEEVEPEAGSVEERTTTPHGEISVEGEPVAGSAGERTATPYGEISEEEVEEEGVCVLVRIG